MRMAPIDSHGNAWSPGSGTIRRHGLGGVGVALLEGVCHCEVGFEVSNAQDPAQHLSPSPVVF